jgi:hypothetical protein
MPTWIHVHDIYGHPKAYNADLFLSIERDSEGRSMVQLTIPDPDPESMRTFCMAYIRESPEQLIALCGEPRRRHPKTVQQVRRRRSAA